MCPAAKRSGPTGLQFRHYSRRSQRCRKRCPKAQRIGRLWVERARLDGGRTSILLSQALSRSGLSSSQAMKQASYGLSAKRSQPRLPRLGKKGLSQFSRMEILALLYGLTKGAYSTTAPIRNNTDGRNVASLWHRTKLSSVSINRHDTDANEAGKVPSEMSFLPLRKCLRRRPSPCRPPRARCEHQVSSRVLVNLWSAAGESRAPGSS